MSLLVTGASGHLGRRVVDLLLANKSEPIIATTRKPQALKELAKAGVQVRRADFDDDEAGLVAAFRGADRALLVSTNERPGCRAPQHQRALSAMERAGVQHVVYTSLLSPAGSPITIAPDHLVTEDAIIRSRLDFTILRNSMYTESLLLTLPQAVGAGQLVDARNNGAVSYVTRDDCARVAAAALMGGRAGRQTFDVTGPEAMTSGELATLTAELTSRPIAYLSVTVEVLVKRLMEQGMSLAQAVLTASFDVAASRGDLAIVSDTVLMVGQRVPTTVRQFLAQNRAELLRDPRCNIAPDASSIA